MKRVTLQIEDEEFAFATRMAEEDGYNGPVDCLNGILSTALLRWMAPKREADEQDDPLARIVRFQDAKIEVLQDLLLQALNECARHGLLTPKARHEDEPGWFDELEEDEGGGMRLKKDEEGTPEDFGEDSDPDDGIPF